MFGIKPASVELSKLRKEVARLKLLVYKDPLTGIFNRRGFTEEVEKMIAAVEKGREHGRSRDKFSLTALSFIMLDIDSFKKLNDAFGHDVGDAALKLVAKTLENHVRQSDFVARWGGEEFVIALLGANENDAAFVAEHLRQEIAGQSLKYRNKKIPLTASFGAAEFKPKDTLETLVKKADKAMYSAKTTGKNKVVKFSGIN
ncbi:MAG: GGDEF domain-containing protein [Patescibacteria group bacterium]|nr:GGDEF domain-containing protein [Patescibacteria group bacterium]